MLKFLQSPDIAQLCNHYNNNRTLVQNQSKSKKIYLWLHMTCSNRVNAPNGDQNILRMAVGTGGRGAGHGVFKWILCGHFKPTPNATL
jgi:hypothetical protein